MAFPRFGKKDPPEPGATREYPAGAEAGLADDLGKAAEDRPAGLQAAARDDGPLVALTERLEHLGRLLDQARDQVTAYLVDRESKLAEADSGKALARRFDSLAAKIEQLPGGRSLDQKLDALYGKLEQVAAAIARAASAAPAATAAPAEGAAPAVGEAALKKVRDGLSEQHTAIGGGIRQIQETLPQYFSALPPYFTALQQQVAAVEQRLNAALRSVVEQLRPPEPEPAKTPVVGRDLQAAILGRDLTENPALDQQREQLLGGMLAGEPSACSLVGNLMIFRSAPAEKKPALLKEIGEACYRWQPRSTNKPGEMEKALVAWLQRACDEAGVPNTIELVHPGERFDSTRHNASERGVEITQVFGWIVLRDNGKVYTKASVAVK
jgi:hypothetical protein